MKVTALAGGVGAGKFLRGLVRVVPAGEVTVVANTGDDIVLHGLHISPDLDSVVYWLAGVMDRERGWGRAGETFQATEALRSLGADDAWFGLGDLDLATHIIRTASLEGGRGLVEVTAELARRFGIESTVLPVTEDPLTTRLDVVDDEGNSLDLHFQEYWVQRGARDQVKSVRYEGASSAVAAPGVLKAIAAADAVLICPSNPVASIGPLLAVPGVRDALRARRAQTAGVSPIVGGAPVRGMADKLLPVSGVEVTAAGVAEIYSDLVSGWVIDEVDRALAERIRGLGLRVAVTDTMMVDDGAAAAAARVALSLAMGDG
jgi:LPPG:FO 2-phospho-L-lactate transferase